MSRALKCGPGPKPRPVLIVNGFSFLPYFQPFPTNGCLDAYRERGFSPIHRVPWRFSGMYDVCAYARQVCRETNRLLKRSQADRVSIVGWSMGGIASLYAMQQLDLTKKVKSLVTFGSPFQGIHRCWKDLFQVHIYRSIRQMTKGSELLTEMLSEPLPANVPIHSIGGQRDIICPAKATILPGCNNLVTGHGHESFLFDSELHRLIADLLTG